MKKLLIIPILAILNMIRGSGHLKRVVFYALIMGSVTYFFNNWLFALIWTCGLALFFAAPWGNGFLVVHGQDTRHYDRSDEWLVVLVDILTGEYRKDDRLHTYLSPVMDIQDPWKCKMWGFVYMLIRGTYILPTLILLAIVYKWQAMLYSIIVLWFPVCYLIGGAVSVKHGVRIGEGLWFAIIGATILLTSYLI